MNTVGPLIKAATDQQTPPQKNEEVHIADLVVDDILARKVAGEAKYGTPLQPNNGRDPLVDLYQELLDAVQYLRQLLYERENRFV